MDTNSAGSEGTIRKLISSYEISFVAKVDG